ncbi:MAG: hypothetical protein HY360_13100 [Verrucomicrobia bacterium]|nr:hypothetical protein [Verrucomicrobiota bacterium]
MSNPPFSQFQQNVLRQSREQKAVGSLLSGMAIALISSIVLVAILAAYGGWVLSRQIQQQSVTVQQLDAKLTTDIRKVRNDLKETVEAMNQAVNRLNAQQQAQKQQIVWLQTQLEELRVQTRKDRATDQLRYQRLENRVYDLERNQAQTR